MRGKSFQTLAAIASLLAAAPAAPGAWAPFGLGVMTVSEGSREAGFPARSASVYGLRLGLYCAANKEMYGLSVSCVANGLFQEGPLFADGDIAGFQIAGLFNDATSAHHGAWQVAGLFNQLREGGSAVQIAAGANHADGDRLDGVQIAGIFNCTEHDFRGLQVAGIVNVVGGDLDGIQIAPINGVAGTMRGVQIGAVNYAKVARGVQIGLFNGVESDFSGVQIGALNTWEKANATALPILRIHF